MTDNKQSLERTLKTACVRGDVRSVSRLIDAAADVNHQDESAQLSRRPLHEAASQGHESCCRALLLSRAAVNAQDRHGVTALHLASKAGHHAVVLELLALNAEPNLLDKQRQAPLHMAAEGGSSSICRSLLDAGAEDSKTRKGTTALSVATKLGHEFIVEMLQGGTVSPIPESSMVSELRSPLGAEAASRGQRAISLGGGLGEQNAEDAFAMSWSAIRPRDGDSDDEDMPRFGRHGEVGALGPYVHSKPKISATCSLTSCMAGKNRRASTETGSNLPQPPKKASCHHQ